MNQPRRTWRAQQHAFSLVEILIVIVVLVTLGAIL